MTFDHADVHIDVEGDAPLKDHVTGEKQFLPKRSINKNIVPVTLVQKINKRHVWNLDICIYFTVN